MCLPLLAPLGAAAAGTASQATIGTLIASSLAISAASAGLAYYGQRQAANSQAEMYNQAQINANEQLKADYAQTAIRVRQEQEAKAQQIAQIEAQARQALSRGQVAAGESGYTGTNYDILMADFARQQTLAGQSVQMNYEARRDQLIYGQSAARANAYNQMASAYPRIGQPSMLTPFLSFGQDAINTYSMFRTPDPNRLAGNSGFATGATNPFTLPASGFSSNPFDRAVF